MKKIILFACFAATLGYNTAQAQLAVNASAQHSYGQLFTDGSTLYEVKADTLYSVATSDGTHTYIDKLPAPPATNFIVKWGRNIMVKTSAGFMIDEQLQDPANPAAATYRVWANTGSGWDTIATTLTSSGGIRPLVKLGSKWAFYVIEPNSTKGSRLVRTDFTKAGTTTVPLPTGTYASDMRQGTDRIYFSMIGNGSNVLSKVVMVDDNSLTVLDSANAGCNTLTALGNDLIYYRDQVTTTTMQTVDYTVRKWTASTATSAVIIPHVPFSTVYKDGATINGNVIVQKVDSGAATQRDNLVNINTATGTETYLTSNTRNGSAYPIYFMQQSGYGTAHAYIVTRDSLVYVTTVTDGATASGTQKIAGPGIFFSRYKSTDPGTGIMCGDDEYGESIATTGIAQQLYHIDPAGAITHQDLNAATIGGSAPGNFVNVGGHIYFTASQAQGTTGYPNYMYDLWKLNCSSGTGASNISNTAVAAMLYPNPATNRLTLKIDGNNTFATLDLYNAAGRKVLSAVVQNNQSVATGSLAAGIYFYRITGVNGGLLGAERILIAR